MATVYGSLQHGYWRVFCTYTVASTATTYTIKAKIGVNCYKNGYKFNNWESSLSASDYSASTASSTTKWVGGTTGNNYTTISEKTYTYNKKTWKEMKTIEYTTENRDYSSTAPGTSGGAVTIEIPALATYRIKYKANAGEDIVEDLPKTQFKFYGIDLVLSSKIPTRTDYIFKGYSTTTDGDVSYQPSHNYTTNSELTLYAQWEADSYTITFDANGGQFDPPIAPYIIGADEAFIFDSEVIPTRQNFLFLGWAPTRDAAEPSYGPGDFYIPTGSGTWYAQWKQAYVSSTITSIKAVRADSGNNYEEDASGESALIAWQIQEGYWINHQGHHTPLVSKYKVDVEGIKGPAEHIGISHTWNTTEPSLIVSDAVFPFYTNTQYAIKITIQDYQTQLDADNNQNQLGSFTRTTYISMASFTIDINADGSAICFFGEAPDDKEGLFIKNANGDRFSLIDIFYPIGSIYETIKSQAEFDPNVSWGGTWQLIQGRFLIGSGAGTDKNGFSQSFTLGATSGEYQHTLTIDEMPSHNHEFNLTKRALSASDGSKAYRVTDSTTRTQLTTTAIANEGGGEAHPILPPYEVVNIWKRTE